VYITGKARKQRKDEFVLVALWSVSS